MDKVIPLLTFLAGVAGGSVAVWLLLNRLNHELVDTRSELKAESEKNAALGNKIARLETTLEEEQKRFDEKLKLLEQAENKLTDTFKSLAAEALNTNSESFLTLAKTKLQPVEETIGKFDASVKKLEIDRVGAYEGLKTQVEGLAVAQKTLNKETANLAAALRSPNVRGRWGEIQLRRVVELAGMLNYCDFREQASQETDGKGIRPDLLVQLPAGKNVVVDSKVPLNFYLDALEAQDESTRNEKLAEHAKCVRSHIYALGGKSYFEHFESTPEFVVMFIASEAFFSAALQQEPGLIEEGVKKNVILATPTTLIALLRAVAYGWRQEQLAENAKRICDLGTELYKRLSKLGGYVSNLGRNLEGATESYNEFVGSFERRVLVTGRKFSELGADAHGVEIESLEPIELAPRRLQAPEFAQDESATGSQQELLRFDESQNLKRSRATSTERIETNTDRC